MKLTKTQIQILKTLDEIDGCYITLDWASKHSRGGLYLSGNGESIRWKTYRLLKDGNLIDGMSITKLGRKTLREHLKKL